MLHSNKYLHYLEHGCHNHRFLKFSDFSLTMKNSLTNWINNFPNYFWYCTQRSPDSHPPTLLFMLSANPTSACCSTSWTIFYQYNVIHVRKICKCTLKILLFPDFFQRLKFFLTRSEILNFFCSSPMTSLWPNSQSFTTCVSYRRSMTHCDGSSTLTVSPSQSTLTS